MTRIQKIREDIFQLQCLDRETSIVSVDDLEWTLRQLQLAEALVRDLSNLTRAGTTPDAGDDDDAAAADADSEAARGGDDDSDGARAGGGRFGSGGDADSGGDGDGAQPYADGQRTSILRRADAFLRDLSAELSIAAPRA